MVPVLRWWCTGSCIGIVLCTLIMPLDMTSSICAGSLAFSIFASRLYAAQHHVDSVPHLLALRWVWRSALLGSSCVYLLLILHPQVQRLFSQEQSALTSLFIIAGCVLYAELVSRRLSF